MAADGNAGNQQRERDVDTDNGKHAFAVLLQERTVMLRKHAQQRQGHEQAEDAGGSTRAYPIRAGKDVRRIRNHIARDARNEVQQQEIPPAQ